MRNKYLSHTRTFKQDHCDQIFDEEERGKTVNVENNSTVREGEIKLYCSISVEASIVVGIGPMLSHVCQMQMLSYSPPPKNPQVQQQAPVINSNNDYSKVQQVFDDRSVLSSLQRHASDSKKEFSFAVPICFWM